MRLLSFLVLFAAALPAKADLWVTTGFWSKHTKDGYQENNTGVGVKYQEWSGGVYKSSYDKDAWYVTYDWQPLKLGMLSAGVSFGAGNGNSERDPQPIVAPTLSLVVSRVGADVILIPPLAGKEGVVALRLRAKLLE